MVQGLRCLSWGTRCLNRYTKLSRVTIESLWLIWAISFLTGNHYSCHCIMATRRHTYTGQTDNQTLVRALHIGVHSLGVNSTRNTCMHVSFRYEHDHRHANKCKHEHEYTKTPAIFRVRQQREMQTTMLTHPIPTPVSSKIQAAQVF